VGFINVEKITEKYQKLAVWVGIIFMIPLSFCIAVSSEMSIKYLIPICNQTDIYGKTISLARSCGRLTLQRFTGVQFSNSL